MATKLAMSSEAAIEKAKIDIRSDPRKFFAIGTGQLPLLVFCNPKSGGNAGKKLLAAFKKLIDPAQVFDMMAKDSTGKPGGAIEGLTRYKEADNLFILVCGGDGTVGWVVSNIEQLGMCGRRIPVGVVPLGTGNDLANTLKSGTKYEGAPAIKLVERLVDSCSVPMDRWTISVDGAAAGPAQGVVSPYGVAPTLAPPQETWNNYFSIGSDAHVTLAFHTKREKNPARYNSRAKNRMAYAMAGLKEVVMPKFKKLMDNVTLICDGVDYTAKLKSKNIISIAFINIPFIGAGTAPWGSKNAVGGFDPPKIWDGRVEVVGYSGQFALMKAQAKSSVLHAMRICQARTVQVTLGVATPVQLDGEACLFGASTITLTSTRQAVMLAKRKGRFAALPSILSVRVPSGYRDPGSVLDGETVRVSVFAVMVDETSTALMATDSYHVIGSIDIKSMRTLADVRVAIDELTHEKVPKKWGFLHFDYNEESEHGVYSFIQSVVEAEHPTHPFINPAPGIRKGFFLADKSQFVKKLSRRSSMSLGKADGSSTLIKTVSEV